MLFHPAEAVATPIQIFAGTEEGRMRRKRRIGGGVCYMPQKLFISLKEKLYADKNYIAHKS